MVLAKFILIVYKLRGYLFKLNLKNYTFEFTENLFQKFPKFTKLSHFILQNLIYKLFLRE